MRIAIDVSALTAGLRSGTAVYLYRLVEALSAEPDVELRILYNGMPGVGVELARSLERPNATMIRAAIRWPLLPGPLFRAPTRGCCAVRWKRLTCSTWASSCTRSRRAGIPW